MAGRSWIRRVLLVALMGCANAAAGAESSAAGGILTGKLTDLRSAPLNGAALILRNEQTGTETRGVTGKNGRFRFVGLMPGAYTIEAESVLLGRGRLGSVMVAAGHEAYVQAAMELAPDEPRAPVPVPQLATLRSTAPATPAVSDSLPLAKMAVLALTVPLTESRVVTGLVPVEDFRETDLSGQKVAPRSRVVIAIETQVLSASLTDEQPQSLSLNGYAAGESLTPAAHGLAGDEPALSGSMVLRAVAAGAAQAAIGAMLPAQISSPAASQQSDPLTNAVSTTLSGAELGALPAAGRRWQDFVLDTPTGSTTAGESQGVVLRGAGQQSAETSMDGVSTRTAFGGQKDSGPGSNGVGGSERNSQGQAWAGGHGSPVAEAAIREVQTAAGNAEADGDRTAGGRVNVDTTHGMNGLHGQGFLFDRQNTWGAQNPFTQWVKETAPATLSSTPVFTAEAYTPPDHEMVWGMGVGSQIRRDKLFWFGALDSYRRNDPGLATVKHPEEFFAQPSNDQMQVLAARLALSSANPIAEGLNAYSGMLTTLDGLLGPAPRTAAQWVGFGRLDWEATERHRFTLEGTGATWNSPGGGLTRVSETYGTNSFGSSKAGEGLLMGRWEAFMTPNLLAVTQGSLGRTILRAPAETPSPYEQTFLAPSVWGQLPQMVVDSRYGFTIGNPSRFGQGAYPDEHVYTAAETLNWAHGNLLIKSGFSLSHNADATSLLRNETGTYNYASVENFVSDALVFAKYGLAGELNPDDQHNCDQTGKVWRDSDGGLRGLGYLPCYSYYSQVTGPTHWNLSTNDWATFSTAQWQPAKLLVISGGLRWEREQLPPSIAALNNADLPLTEKLPSLGNDFGPRISLALGSLESHWPVLRLGYGMYFGRTENATLETALTQTGSPNGDQSIFMRPTDNLNAGGAPPFPYVLSGAPASVVKPGAVEFAASFRNPEVHQSVVAVEEALPWHMEVTASALVSLGRRLPVFFDANIGAAAAGAITYAVVNCPEALTDTVVTCTGTGPIKAAQITVPFYASWPVTHESTGDCPTPGLGWLNPCYQQINQITGKANSTYEAAVLKVARYGSRGLSLHAHYTYSHAMDWNPDESPLDPSNFRQEYGTSDHDMRHSAAAIVVYEAPWKLRSLIGQVGNGWMISGIGQFHSGLPYTMRVSGSLPECVVSLGITPCTSPNAAINAATGYPIVGLAPGINGSGGDNRIYGIGSDGRSYNIGRNTFRYPATWKADMRVGKKIDLGKMRQLELLVESFNLFNHQNVTELETTGYYIEAGTASSPPTLNYLNSFTAVPALAGSQTSSAFGQPLNVNATNFYRERQIQVGVRMRF